MRLIAASVRPGFGRSGGVAKNRTITASIRSPTVMGSMPNFVQPRFAGEAERSHGPHEPRRRSRRCRARNREQALYGGHLAGRDVGGGI